MMMTAEHDHEQTRAGATTPSVSYIVVGSGSGYEDIDAPVATRAATRSRNKAGCCDALHTAQSLLLLLLAVSIIAFFIYRHSFSSSSHAGSGSGSGSGSPTLQDTLATAAGGDSGSDGDIEIESALAMTMTMTMTMTTMPTMLSLSTTESSHEAQRRVLSSLFDDVQIILGRACAGGARADANNVDLHSALGLGAGGAGGGGPQAQGGHTSSSSHHHVQRGALFGARLSAVVATCPGLNHTHHVAHTDTGTGRATSGSGVTPTSSGEMQMEMQARYSQVVRELRVAVRRLRSVLEPSGAVMGHSIVAHCAEHAKWLFGLLGPTSDLVVLLDNFDQNKASLGDAGESEAFEPIRARLNLEVQHQLVRFTEGVQSQRMQDLLAEFGQFLYGHEPVDSGVTHYRPHRLADHDNDDDAPDAFDPVAQVASAEVWHQFTRVIKHGRRLSATSAPHDVHALRKTTKALRYLMESFQSLWPARSISLVYKNSVNLQKSLGRLQDIVAQRNYFLYLIGSPLPKDQDPTSMVHFLPVTSPAASASVSASDNGFIVGSISTPTATAIRSLLARLYTLQQQQQTLFPRHFAAFDTAECREEASAVFWQTAHNREL